jgi:hypothetical protein
VTWNASSPLTDLNQLFASSIGNGHPCPNQYQESSPDQEIPHRKVFGPV